MIDPSAVTHITRTESELEEFILFCIVVAGKNADQQARKLEDFLGGAAPFPLIRSLRDGELDRNLKRVKLGKYALLGESFRRLARALPVAFHGRVSVSGADPSGRRAGALA